VKAMQDGLHPLVWIRGRKGADSDLRSQEPGLDWRSQGPSSVERKRLWSLGD
jgi:hypothetical protein